MDVLGVYVPLRTPDLVPASTHRCAPSVARKCTLNGRDPAERQQREPNQDY